MSPCNGRSEAAKVASSFPGSSGEMMVMKAGIVGGGSNTPKSSWTTASVAKTRPGISGTTLLFSDTFYLAWLLHSSLRQLSNIYVQHAIGF